MASQNLYKYNVEMTFVNGSNATDIDSKQIKSIVIDYNYDECNMPMIFLTINIRKKILDDMIKNMNTGLINFTLYKYVTNSDVSNIKTIRIKDQFVYFVPDDLNPNRQIDEANEVANQNEDLYKTTTIGLMKLDHLKWNKKQINGVINSTTMINAVYYCAGHMPLLIEPFTYNTSINQLVIPPVSSVAKALDYLNNISVFYNTPYRFFMDFDVVYLLSSAGKPVIKKGEKMACNSVTLKIHPTSSKMSVNQGLIIDNEQKVYKIDISSANAKRTVNKITEKSFNSITAVTADQKAGTAPINVNNSTYMNTKNRTIKLPNGNTNMLSNITASVQNNAVMIDINKNDLDSSIFTLNKEYMIDCVDVYPGNEGKYLLGRKKEFYIKENDDYISNVMLTFRKIATT